MTAERAVYERQPLRNRESVMHSDVCDAIRELVAPQMLDGHLSAPVALDQPTIIEQLILLAHKEDDGIISEITPIVRRTMFNSFIAQLSDSSVLRVGYKKFEADARLPVVPVTTFFFKRVYTEATRDCLDAMSHEEIRQSLPRRESRVRDPKTGHHIRDDDDEFIVSGSVAGIVVFPPNMNCTLLTEWLRRRSNVMIGSVQSTIASIEHARPDSESVTALSTYGRDFTPVVRKALPRPRKRDTP